MKLPQPNLLLKNIAFVVLLVAASILAYQFAARYPLQRDLTQNAINSLEPGSVTVLQQLHGEVTLTVFSSEQDPKQGDLRRRIREFVALYQRYKSDIVLVFIDPAQNPEAVRQAEIQSNGEMVVEYGGRREHLTMLNEQALTSALMSLAHRHEQLVMYLDGHGERKLDGVANYDLGEFGKRLQQNGFRVSSLNLAIAQDVPDNANLLVITQPQLKLMPGEVDKLLRYIDRGGNLLWLLDAEPLHGLEALSDKLGLLLTPGIVLDPAAAEARAPLDWALSAGYPPHAITANFNLITVFPYARALDWEERSGWQHSTLVEAAPRGWISRNPKLQRFDKNRDIPGPVALALTLQRDINDREQRIVVVGSGGFLANTYAGNGGNLDLGLNIANWLTDQDKLIAIAPRAAKDDTVTLSRTKLTAITLAFVVVLPLLLVAMGGWLWWRRR